ncbi:hypothetical protein [Dactylosporangium sp. CA-233914]|uniref:hypothetical protein n=1 Tax=Dactylosporangium sp. CA-233914 TaxID=3239934 RepID=UPI003D8CFD28
MSPQLPEIVMEMLRDRPALVAELLTGQLYIEIPEFETATLAPADLTGYRPDAVITLNGADGPVLAVAVDVQLGIDPAKRHRWPEGLAVLHARLDCPVALLVLCPGQDVVDWAGGLIHIGPPSSVVTPLALGPHQIPYVTGLDAARRSPELAVLWALAHGSHPGAGALDEALEAMDHERAERYRGLLSEAV